MLRRVYRAALRRRSASCFTGGKTHREVGRARPCSLNWTRTGAGRMAAASIGRRASARYMSKRRANAERSRGCCGRCDDTHATVPQPQPPPRFGSSSASRVARAPPPGGSSRLTPELLCRISGVACAGGIAAMRESARDH